MELLEYKERLVHEIKAKSISENMSDKEAFFELFGEKLQEADVLEDYHYLSFNGRRGNRKVHIDGYSYDELDQKLTLFTIPDLTYYDSEKINQTEAMLLFNRAKNFYLYSRDIIEGAEESSEGYGLAYDLAKEIMKVKILSLIIFTDMTKSNTIDVIESKEEDGVRIDFAIYDITRMKAIDESVSGKEIIEIDIKKDFNCEGIPCLPASKTKEYDSYLANIPGMLLAQLYDKFQSRLLEGNVRSFLQTKGKVNKGIRNTILNNPDKFFAYNNGIAATAESVEIENTEKGLMITKLTSLQIVNGGQTTASLANALVNDKNHGSEEQIKKIYVPMKLSVVNHEKAEELIPEISRFANSQNKVSEADLASNHPFYRVIEDLSRRIPAPARGGAQFGTYWYFERANGQYRQETYKATESFKKKFENQNPKNQMFKKVDLAKYYNIYLKKPHIASAGGQKSFTTFSTWMVKQWDKNQHFVNEDFYRKLIAIAILFRKADSEVKRQAWYNSYKANIVAYTLSIIFYNIEKKYPNYSIDFNNIWRKQDLSTAWILEIRKISKIMYEHLIKEDRIVENVTEWAKRETCWEEAKKIKIEFSDEFLSELICKSYVKTAEYSAIKQQKEFNELNATVEVVNYGIQFWKELLKWGDQEKIWNVQDRKFLELAIGIKNGKIPTDKQSIKILKVLEKAREESFPR